VEKKQYNLCIEVLRRFDKAGILEHIILIGSWCMPFYSDYFKDASYGLSLRTRDLDFLIPIPAQLKNKVDLARLLEDLGFIYEFVGEGYTKLVHPELAIEFLVPERGRGSDKPFSLSAIGVNAQQLRYLDLLSRHVIRVNKEGFSIALPHPALFAFHKLIIASLRKEKSKSDKDTQEAIRTLKELLSKDGSGVVYRYFQVLLPTWRKKVLKKIEEIGDNDILAILKGKSGR
jgi:hypothetical protein